MSLFRYKYSDGGQSKSPYQDDNDCTVRALAIYNNWDYSTTYELLQSHGWANTPGSSRAGYLYTYFFGLDLYIPDDQAETRNYFLCDDDLPKTCIVFMLEHVSAVINGVVYDKRDPRRCWCKICLGSTYPDRNHVYGFFLRGGTENTTKGFSLRDPKGISAT